MPLILATWIAGEVDSVVMSTFISLFTVSRLLPLISFIEVGLGCHRLFKADGSRVWIVCSNIALFTFFAVDYWLAHYCLIILIWNCDRCGRSFCCSLSI